METEAEALAIDRERAEQKHKIRLLEEALLKRCAEKRLPINQERLRMLLPSVGVADLDDKDFLENEKLKRAYGGLKRIFAHIDQLGNVNFNQNEFFKLTEVKQQNAYAHELGHRLDDFLKRLGTEEYSEIQELITGMPADQISLHVYRTTIELGKKADQTGVDEMIRSEAMAELMAQYFNSDGSFKGFLETKLATNVDGKSQYWLDNEESAATMNEAGQFDDWDGDEQLAYFDHHPEMIDHFHIYQNLRSMLNNHELMDHLFSSNEDSEGDEIFESMSLAETMPAPTTLPDVNKQELPAKEAGKYDFWSIFRLF
ncbi:MAG: hypothetical protein AAB669_00570 [Patescibacteria group bacterium]